MNQSAKKTRERKGADVVKEARLSTLQFDPELIELRVLDAHVVSRYRQAVREGAQFPPLVVDRKTKCVVSGNHRLTAYRAELPENAKVRVVWRKFKTRADVLRCTVKENLTHGLPMDTFTKKKFSLALASEGMTRSEIATLFGVPEKKIVKWGSRFFVVPGKNGRPEPKPPKGEVDIKPGAPATAEQYEEHKKRDLGFSVASMAEQIMRWLENGWVDLGKEKTREALEALRDVLNKRL